MPGISGGTYAIADSTEQVVFPVPITTWVEQDLGDGLNGIPVFNAYRLHTWRWSSLTEEYMAKLAAFQRRQQTNNTAPTAVETEPYDPLDDCDGTGHKGSYRTELYDDVRIKSLSRERGFSLYTNVMVTFEILVA